MKIPHILKEIGTNIRGFIERMVEALKEMMETPTPCQQCQQVYLYKELCPSFSSWWQEGLSPYEQMLKRMLREEALRPYLYCPVCWEGIYRATCKKCEEEYRLTILLPVEAKRVEKHNERAWGLGWPATLTITEWIRTLDHYEWRCAYCRGPYEELEHWAPLVGGGGTVAENCIPSCQSCNRRKGIRHPDEIMERESSLSPVTQRRIRTEMETLHGGIFTVLSPSSPDGREV